MNVGSLFSGIGGLDLGLERAGMRVVWQCESDPYARAVLRKHWPDVPCYEDVREVGARNAVRVDLICGGFPCQDISYAGRGAGLAGDRSGLWFEFARVIRELGPEYVLVENVAALLDRGLGDVLGTLADLGFDAEWSVVSACAMGAPHVRRRVFIVAHANGLNGRPRLRDSAAPQPDWPLPADDGSQGARPGWEARLADPSALYGDADGLPFGMERNRCLGNAVVPQVAEYIGRLILAHAQQGQQCAQRPQERKSP